jgi:soluble lytic murein transglycosylase-like protein
MMRARLVARCLLACLLASYGGLSLGANPIYLSTTQGGLPHYSSEAGGVDSVLYLTVGDPPPPRPRIRRTTSAAMGYTATNPSAFANLIDPSYERLAHAASQTYKVPHALLMAVMHAESHFNPRARSPVGAVGLMQIMPPTGRRYGVYSNLANPAINIDVGVRYLKDLLILFDGNEQLAVAAYNAGEGAVIKYGRRIPPYAETQAYVPKVMSLYGKYSEKRNR